MSAMTKPLILVADDSEHIRDFLEHTILVAAGYRVQSVGDGMSALTLAKELNPAVIVTDYNMPSLNGLELVKRIHRERPWLPCIMMSGEPTQAMLLEALRAGVLDFLPKPFDPEEMLAAVERGVRSHSEQRSPIGDEPENKTGKTGSLEKRLRELETLTNIGRSMTSMLELDEVLSAVVEAAVTVTGAEEGSLLLIDQQTGELYMHASKNFDEEFAKTFRVHVNDSLAGKAIETGQRVKLDQTVPQKIKTSYLVHSLLYEPLQVRNRILGVLGVDNRTPGKSLTEHDETLVKAIADYAAIAIENAQLYERAVQGRQELESILHQVDNGVVIVDEKQRLILINRSAKDALGVEVTSPGVDLAEVVHNPSFLELIRTTEGARRVEIEVEDGRFFHAQRSQIEGVGQAIVMQDITHLKELDRIKSDFVTAVSHDLRSPLTAILGYVDLIKRAGEVNEVQAKFIRRVRTSVEQITALIDDLLDLGRIESGLDSEKQDTDLAPIIRDVVSGVMGTAKLKQMAMDVDLPDSLPTVRGDPIRLRQMLGNLVDNAVKYCGKEGRVRIAARAEDDQIILHVTDTGPGIPPADQPYLFDKFYRGSNVPDDLPGTGLGLSIVKSIVDTHNGRIWVDSRLGEGTTFSVVLPTRV